MVPFCIRRILRRYVSEANRSWRRPKKSFDSLSHCMSAEDEFRTVIPKLILGFININMPPDVGKPFSEGLRKGYV